MNKKRRTKISNVIKRLNDCKDDLESIKEDEDEARENIPEPFQDCDTYCESEECSDKIEDAISDLKDIVQSLENI